MLKKELKKELGELEKLKELDYRYYVIYGDKAYDVRSDDDCLSDPDIDVLGGFGSADMAFAVAQGINSGFVKVKGINTF